MRRQVEHDERMRALDSFLAEYEGKSGVITDEEIVVASRRARAEAVVVRGRPTRAARRR